ncbi:tRNA pseudouridine(55) synthase TruB [Paenibacillus radicis (ex Gao et al. 2016)]|uniref:tRNA pseudouridine synthase B n=1 Tax=Paenibacillus radicis (ex Gao et al. 2016) TaxID=1737354 RepID=A0A917HJS4_9BACL|nr:tRNA pseudouridine(55) synthase TruB [Paenibacillus radicis (ex Gao et al. 2016)]GGG80447.1 tRNA pseudouridine synthase B [Paenibacillus radicis (ex Gao et al. 2016)]
MDGIIAIWKPAGWTSHDVVAKVRRLTKMKRIGHAGTLDPMVTGVLPLCLGRSTRMVEYLQERPKAYEAVIQLGIATDTEDLTGNVVEEISGIVVTEEEVIRVLRSFVGEIEQIPPMFSAVKVDGKRLYELAREGKTVERKARKATIHQIELQGLNLSSDKPTFSFSVVCSKGTYIRTLCVDIGRELGVPAAMAQLTRTMSGGITKEQCVTLEQVEELQEAGELESRLLSAEMAISHLELVQVSSVIADMALKGQKIPLRMLAERPSGDRLIRLYGEGNQFIGIFEWDTGAEILKPVKVFS